MGGAMEISVRVLGPVQVRHADRPARLTAQAAAVLAGLALSDGEALSPGQLIELLWPDRPPRAARAQVQNVISALRRALRPAGGAPEGAAPRDSAIPMEPAGYRLRLEPGQLDLRLFRDELAAARALRHADRPEAALLRYEHVLRLWQGQPCTDVDLPMVGRLREPLTQVHADALEEWAELALALGPGSPGRGSGWEGGPVVLRLYAALAEHPFRERLRGQLIRALWAGGRRAEALGVYEEGRRRLADELGVDPSPALRELHRRMVGDSQGSGPDRVPAQAPLLLRR